MVPDPDEWDFLCRRSCAGVLEMCIRDSVECGFLTNPEEARKLQTELYQQRVAAAVADGIDTYLHVDNRKSYS